MRLNRKRLRRQQLQLDEVFAGRATRSDVPRPQAGWLKAVRESLGMTTAQLGRRLKVSQSAVVRLEQSERRGSIALKTLARVAEALDCRVTYSLVPRTSLKELVAKQAIKAARAQVERAHQSMALEQQSAGSAADERHVHELAEAFASALSSSIWDVD